MATTEPKDEGPLTLWEYPPLPYSAQHIEYLRLLQSDLGVTTMVLELPRGKKEATFRDEVVNREMTGMFRTGWQMDYPSIENFLVPLYKTGASANDGDYSSQKFDQLVDEAATKPGQEGIDVYQQAEAVLAEDMPVIPMWYGSVVAGYSENVSNVQFTPFSRVDLLTIQSS